MKDNKWARLLAYVTGLVNQELLLQNEYLAAENRILKAHSPRNLRLSDGERSTLAEIGKRLGRKGLQQVARLAKPDTILGWYRKLVAEKFDGSKHRRLPGRPRASAMIENLVVRLARENSGWGYDRIVGALANLGHRVSDQTVGNILRRHGIGTRTGEKPNDHLERFHSSAYGRPGRHGLLHGRSADLAGLATYYVLFFIHLGS